MRPWECSRISGRAGEFQSLGCALAVFVPFATAARLLGWYSGGTVSPQAVWGWVQAAGQHVMETLQEHLHALAQGDLPRQKRWRLILPPPPWSWVPMG